MTFSTRSDKYGELASGSFDETMDFLEAPAYGPSRNFYSDTLKGLAVGQSTTWRDGYDRATVVTRLS